MATASDAERTLQTEGLGLLAAILVPILVDPPEMPDWPHGRWRAAMAQVRGAPAPPEVLGDPRLRPLLAWASTQAAPPRRLGAAAAALAILDAAVANGTADPEGLAEVMAGAVRTAPPVGVRPRGQRDISPTGTMDRHPDPSGPAADAADRDQLSIADVAANLLDTVGCDLRAHPALRRRLVAAVDVVAAHWLSDAAPGGGLPAFRSEHGRRYESRLYTRLGNDRDLLRLLWGPNPSRGHTLQECRRRGLVYWAARWWTATDGMPPPPVPTEVVAHWRREMARLGIPAAAAQPATPESRYAPSA